MGYDGVEFAGYYGYSADELMSILEDLGLKVAGTHTKIDNVIGEELEKTIEFNRILDNKFIIIPSLPENMRNSRASWLNTAHLVNKISERLMHEGMYIGYHNHISEFKLMGDELPLDIFFGATGSDVVMQLDTGHAMRAGVNPIKIMKRYQDRLRTIHLKEFSSFNENALIGEGETEWKEIVSLCENIEGMEWYIIEQENYAFPPLECVKRDIDNLKKIIGE